MKLKALTFYSNKMMTVKPNQVFEVDDRTGEYLIKTFPNWFEVIEEKKDEDSAEVVIEKRGRPRKNK